MREIRIKSAITLCHIIEGYDSFIKDVELIWKKNNYFYFIEDLKKVSFKENIFGKREAKKFYKEHSLIINTINEHSRIDIFLKEFLGDENKQQSMYVLYEYLLKNEADIEQILTLLEQIRSLGFQSILFDENADFTKEEYNVFQEPIRNYNANIGYLENLERIPSYGKEKIKYKSNDSHYKIKFSYSHIDNKFLIDSTIYLNSLLFDPSLLPSFSSKPDILFEKIIDLKKDKVEECQKLTDAVNVKLKLMDLKSELRSAKQTLKELSNMEERNLLENALLYMELELARMEQVDCENDKELMENNSITEDILKRECPMFVEVYR